MGSAHLYASFSFHRSCIRRGVDGYSSYKLTTDPVAVTEEDILVSTAIELEEEIAEMHRPNERLRATKHMVEDDNGDDEYDDISAVFDENDATDKEHHQNELSLYINKYEPWMKSPTHRKSAKPGRLTCRENEKCSSRGFHIETEHLKRYNNPGQPFSTTEESCSIEGAHVN